MAIIGKIRKRSGLLVALVGVSLALFILSDLWGNGGGGQGQPTEALGEIYGDEIDFTEFQMEVDRIVQENFTARGGAPSEEQMDQIREYVWSHMVNQTIYDHEFGSFDITVTPREMEDLIFGNNIQPDIMNNEMFKDSLTGQFSLAQLKKFRQQVDQSPEYRQYWVSNIEKPLFENRRVNKYFSMITKGMYVTTAEANADYLNNMRKFKIKYVHAPYANIADSTIAISEEDMKAYYDKNKHRKSKYNNPGSRIFTFVEFSFVPSEKDIEAARKKAEDLKEGFIRSENDSDYVMRYAETKQFSNEVMVQPFPGEIDSLVQKSDSGAVIGPVRDGDMFKVIKVRGITYETEARCRHILLSKDKGPIDKLKKRADSIISVIKRAKNFDEMVTRFTDDPGSKSTGGVYEWFPKGRMVKPFEDACFNGALNKMQVVETDYGIHIVEPLDRREVKRIKQATVDVRVAALKETQDKAHQEAYDFYKLVEKDPSKFQEMAQKQKLTVQSDELGLTQKDLSGGKTGPGSRNLAMWVQRSEEGALSDPMRVNESYVVATVTNIKEKGVPELDDVREMVKARVLAQKKGEILAKKLQGVKSLEEAATRVSGQIMDAEVTFNSAIIPGTNGSEYRVVGSIFSMKKRGDFSIPLVGENGVFVVLLENIVEPQPAPDLAGSRKTLTTNLRSRAQSEAYNAMREKAKIVDNRYKFF